MAPLLRQQKRSPRQRSAIRFAKRAAIVLLVMILCFGAFLAVDAEAREAVMKWFRETFTHSVVYRFTEEEHPETAMPVYTLGWVPNGFELTYEYYDDLSGIRMLGYEERDGDRSFSFDYFPMVDSTTITLSEIDDTSNIEKVEINGMEGEFCPANGTDDYSSLLWFDLSQRISFSLDGNLPKDVMLHMAKDVKLENSTK